LFAVLLVFTNLGLLPVALLAVGSILLFIAQAAIVVVDKDESAIVTIFDNHYRTFHTGVHLVPPLVADVMAIETGPWPVEIPIQKTTTSNGRQLSVNPRCHVAVRDIARWAQAEEDPRDVGGTLVTKSVKRALEQTPAKTIANRPDDFASAVEDMIAEPARKRGLEVTEVEILDVKAPGSTPT